MFFVKGMPPFGSRRTHHVHVTEPHGEMWQRLAFRDHLRAHPKEAEINEVATPQLSGRRRNMEFDGCCGRVPHSSRIHQTNLMEPRIVGNIAYLPSLSVRAMHPYEEKFMTNRFLISAAVAALIAGTGFANAQGMGNQGMGNQGTGNQGGGMSREAPSAGSTAQPSAPSTERGGAASGTMQRDTGSASGTKGAESIDKKGPDSPKMKASESNEKMPSSKSAQDTKAPAGDKSKSMSSETETKGAKDMKAETKGTTDTKGSMDSKSASDSKNASDNKSATDTKTQTTGNAATSATSAPPAEKRTQIVSAIKTEKIEQTTNVNFNIAVGAMVPSTVRFHPLPPRIVEIYPEWRGYEVILVSGRYIIVRPRTHEIVYIIEG